jgi:hypothetical protein
MADTPATNPNSAPKEDPEAGLVEVTLAHPLGNHKPGYSMKVDEIEAKRLRRVGIAEPAEA